ncbi:hypothetical protein AMI01nite_61470 [Aneurinibacillus migulanus]|nr:hypothetical protein AMI01nite_61470 [Aneurinibacillus migulanus]
MALCAAIISYLYLLNRIHIEFVTQIKKEVQKVLLLKSFIPILEYV